MVEAITESIAVQLKGNPLNTLPNHAEAGKQPRKAFRRRHFLVDRRRQLAATVRIAGVVLVLLITINAGYAWQSYTTTDEVMARNRVLGEIMRATDVRNMILLAGFSMIILAMVVARTITYTHRTAGAVYKVTQCLEKIGTGRFDVTLRLRSKDSLRDLEDPFDRMAKTLLRYADEDSRAITKVADEIVERGSPADAEPLREIAEAIGKRVGDTG